jgi:hypothetical protein
MARRTFKGHTYRSIEVWIGSDGKEGLYGVEPYPRSSVNAGHDSYQWLGPYSEHEADFPGLGNNGRGRPPVPQLSHSAPSWFDEDYAGESWGDDY